MKVIGTEKKPRISVFKSLKHIWLQVINDVKSQTILSLSDKDVKQDKKSRKQVANLLGQMLAKKMLSKKINSAVFDRSKYKYHGIIREVAEGARNAGLKI